MDGRPTGFGIVFSWLLRIVTARPPCGAPGRWRLSPVGAPPGGLPHDQGVAELRVLALPAVDRARVHPEAIGEVRVQRAVAAQFLGLRRETGLIGRDPPAAWALRLRRHRVRLSGPASFQS
jgi:hypothetical protein